MAKNKKEEHDSVEEIEHALTKAERYIEDNQKSLSIIVGVILGAVLLYLGFKNFYLDNKNAEAAEEIYVAEQYFAIDSFQLALEGDGSNLGFLDISEQYGITKTANVANYYSGLCYLNMGDYQQAIKYFKKFGSKDNILGPMSLGNIGDAYSELEDYKKAVSYYEKAYNYKKNDYTTPMFMAKAALLYERLEDYDKALGLFKDIKLNYPESTDGKKADKYIAKYKVLAN
jgi:tetratricopeptide (TPR) repeat protein